MAPKYSEACIEAVAKLFRDCGSLTAYRANPKFGVGPSVGSWACKLECELERRFKIKHVIVCSSGTAALHAALEAVDVRGWEVITSPVTFSATVAAIVLAGGIPVFADVDETGVINAKTVRAKLKAETRTVLPVHLFGPRFFDFKNAGGDGCSIEDACQAIGIQPKPNGLSCFSFGSRKQVRCGEGGAVVTDSEDLARRVRLLVNHGENFGPSIGANYRLNEVSSCIAYHSLQDFKDGTPYAVIDPEGVPYLDKHLGHYPAFQKYMRGPLPGADEFLRKTRIRYV